MIHSSHPCRAFSAAFKTIAALGIATAINSYGQDNPALPNAVPSANQTSPAAPANVPNKLDAPGTTLDEVVVTGRAEDLIGMASSSSQGEIGAGELAQRPFLRRGELLETIPGVVITQHSGDGKANQYFLRGFDLDHGSDINISVDDIPVNMPTHAHGQGYSDLNFLIPELVETLDYQKGPFYPKIGDFSGAGAAQFHLFNVLPEGVVNVGFGENGYARFLAADSPKLGPGNLLYAFEFNHYDGPWVHAENSNRYNGILRYSWTQGNDAFSLTAMAYHADWNSTDQVAQRAIDEGIISRFGSLDPTDGGATDRDSLSFDWKRQEKDGETHLNLYSIYYRLNLFSNFEYFLDDPVHGDQFEQIDKRVVLGGNLTREWDNQWLGKEVKNTVGVQIRDDIIPYVGINHTEDRNLLNTVVKDRVNEFSIGMFVQNEVQWTPWFKTQIGVRGDLYNFDVNANIAGNSGNATAAIASPKLSLVFGPWAKTELYLDFGTGFHSNDARGVLETIDPNTVDKAVSSAGLVQSRGAEIGARTSIVPGLVSTLSFWYLETDSELVFDGDSGGTDAAGPTRRYGVEWANFYKPTPWLTLDADFCYSHGNFTGYYPPGTFIPNSIATVFSAGASLETPWGVFGSLRVRYFGPQPLIEDGSAWAPSSTLFNGRIGYHVRKDLDVALDVLNIFDTKANDIEYYYTSRLSGEPLDGVNDYHLHPTEPRQIRASVTYRF